jgi:sigma-E factor negative regulatory protein RseC
MTEEIGIVKSVEGITAKVIIERTSSCSSCCTGCQTQDDAHMIMDALNPINAKTGQRVKISLKPMPYLKGVLFVYGLPMILFIVAAMVGKRIGQLYFQEINSDLTAAALAFAMLIISYLFLKAWSTKPRSAQGGHPVIEEIIDEQSSDSEYLRRENDS